MVVGMRWRSRSWTWSGDLSDCGRRYTRIGLARNWKIFADEYDVQSLLDIESDWIQLEMG